MLEYDEDEGILWITPMLNSTIIKTRSKDIVVTIDDCECKKCIEARGVVSIDRSIHLKIPIGRESSVVQRLSIEAANMLGKALVAYAENLDNMIEEE